MATETTMTPEEIAAREAKIKEQKVRKLANDKRLKELHKQEALERVEKAGVLLTYLKENGLYDNLTENLQDFVTKLACPAVSRNTTSVFTIMFGDNPKVGDSITLMEAFQKTQKGKANIDHFVKKWEKSGIIVACEPNPDVLQTKYVIKDLNALSETADEE